MSAIEEIFARAMELPQAERADLAYRSLVSLEPDDFDPDAEQAWQVELLARLGRVERGVIESPDNRDVVHQVRACPRRQQGAPG
jgi:hypothetical protein